MLRVLTVLAVIGTVFLLLLSFHARPSLNLSHKVVNKEILNFTGQQAYQLVLVDDSPNDRAKYCSIVVNDQTKGYAYLGRVNSCRAGGCQVEGSTDDQTSEYFDYLVLCDSSLTVKQVKVISYMATHGQEISNRGWLGQFLGFDGTYDLEVGNQIDAISGATISVYAITHNMNQAMEQLRSLVLGGQCAKLRQ